jgi:hypothetical protein
VSEPTYLVVDKFDRLHGALVSLPDVASSKPATVVTAIPLIGATQTFVVQTYRQVERDGDDAAKSKDTVFLQCMDSDGRVRLVIPQQVVDALIRQRESLTTKLRRKLGREQAAARKARGELPGFATRKKESR